MSYIRSCIKNCPRDLPQLITLRVRKKHKKKLSKKKKNFTAKSPHLNLKAPYKNVKMQSEETLTTEIFFFVIGFYIKETR